MSIYTWYGFVICVMNLHVSLRKGPSVLLHNYVLRDKHPNWLEAQIKIDNTQQFSVVIALASDTVKWGCRERIFILHI